jgi:transcriptional regulator with XRE-family HTH domain
MIERLRDNRRQALGEFLRAQRARLKPADLGLPVGARRRTPGLRREELAQICGVSVTWITWMEQGRDVSASPATLSRLALGLRLTRAGRAYVFDLAGRVDPDQTRMEPDEIPASILASVESIAAPAYVLDRSWTARGWNRLAARLFVGWLDVDSERNLLRYIFLRPAARALICDWEWRARRVVAEFRASIGNRIDDPDLIRLSEELRRSSMDFETFWGAQGVLEREGGERTFNHPTDGFQRYEQISLKVEAHPEFKLTILHPRVNPANDRTG